MASERRCSYCGGVGHDVRNCPAKRANAPRDKAVWYKVDNLTDNQADRMTSGVIKLKNKIAPEAQGTFVSSDKKSLSERIKKALGMEED